MTKSRDLGNLAQTVAVNLPNALGTAGQSLVVNSGADGLEFGAASGGSGVTVYTGLSGTDGTPSGATYLLNASSPSAGDLAYVSSNTSLYQNNGNGWYRIATINTTPRIDSVADASSNTTPFTLEGGTNTVITVTATDDDQGTDLTYSHSVTSGSLNGTTVTQGTGANENVFTIAPHASNATTFSITFTVSDSINAATSVAAFTLEFSIADSHYTTLLMATDGSAGDNNDITDSSSSSHTITVSGDAHAGTFSPYRHGGYSTYFDGSGDWLELTGTALGNGNFTVEAWVWLDSLKDYNVIYDDRATGSSATGLALGVTSTGAPYLYTNNGFQITSSQTCTAKTWHHISLVRSSGVITIYLDGTSGGTYSSSANFTDTNLGIGVARTYTVTSQFGGYIRDVRAVVGSAITPSSGGPTEPLTAVTNTSLFTCHLPYIADTPPTGGTAKTITVNGDPETKPFGPYDYQEYASSTDGGSVYFDGSDYLQLSATATDLLPETSNTTIEAWVNTTGTGHVSVFSNFNPSSPYNGMEVGLYNGYQTIYSQGSWINNTGGTGVSTINDGSWHHLAWVITNSGATVTTYVDGVQNYTSSITASTTGSSNQRIGASSNSTVNRHFTGYISDVRFVKGTAVYSGAFTPPTGPLTTTGGTYPSTTNVDTSITASNTSLLLKGTDAHVIDKSQGNNLKLIGTTAAVISSSSPTPPNNTTISSQNSIFFDGNSDYITIPDDELFGWGTGSWTFEVWLYCTKTGGFNAIFDTRVGTGTETGSFGLGVHTTGRVQMYSSPSAFLYPNDTLSFNTWQHLAIVKDASTNVTKMYFNGTASSTTYSDTRNYGASQPVQIGKDDTTSNYFGGYMQDLRVTKGKALYTSNFTVPSSPLKA